MPKHKKRTAATGVLSALIVAAVPAVAIVGGSVAPSSAATAEVATLVATRDTAPLTVGTGVDVAGTGEGAEVVADHDANIRQLARSLFGDNVFAFELTSVLLIVAVAGTVVLTRRLRRRDAAEEREEVAA